MCGIGGIVYKPGATLRDDATLARFASALAHRGPDGIKIERLGRADLIHARLSIIDLEGGDQPIHAGPAAMIANGEIYNDPVIRTKIGNDHYTTGSDCESALRLWQRDTRDFALHLRGMYAIAIYDADHDTLVLTRDPFGIKPLYIAELTDGIAFASEAAPLIAAGLVPPGIDTVKRAELLQLQFTTGSPTIFPGITRLLPGENLHIQSGSITNRTRQSPLPAGPVEQIDEETALTRLDSALMDSVRVHERADVPFGLFLSGGIDSSTVLAAMSRLRREAGQGAPLLAWTATFDTNNIANESEHAARLAKAAGAIHEIVHVTREDFWRHLPAIAGCMDDPVADYAIIPTWLLARRARESATVVLSGEGGDELFAGYGRYRRALRPWWRGGRKMRHKGIFDGLDILRPEPTHWRTGLATTERSIINAPTRLAALQAADIAEWLPNDLLLKLDRCLMDHGLEGRTPLLDPAVASAIWRLPDTLRIRDGKGKYLLRRWLERELPDSHPFAPKQGFTVPVGEWIAQESARLAPLIASQPSIAAIADPDRVRSLFRDVHTRKTGPAAWTLLFYALWHRIHLEGADRNGDVFETLSSR
ncbi:asparagine synthase (glutamine-hydrolyzing) [Acetobacter fallax]|uniref:asparagine synthase (glutamine-hydrolyzing) n=1 Tax=Acetobacter fallax TaxID=1737473 RepID=A0ABX0K7N5_9PROT|nr:asparagine synthase (glutamine-hydrolyzing) [Acetobacter fallax]NHO31767.1 asparagine synthase (glutamine-hydrolyzing) [Acetobacter fallax]NHO35326.1 asparagine synthase (glutamine-hydrolyzing) [Acetobacter fallax]